MMGVIEPERTPAPISMEQEQAVAAESEAAPREEEVIPEGTAEAEAGGVVLDQGPALTNETLRDWVKRWCGGDREGLPPISTWSTSKVKDMSYLFGVRQVWMDGRPGYDSCVLPKSAASFNDDISAWDTSAATSMFATFQNAKQFNQPLNDWEVSGVTSMVSMFAHAESFNQPLDSWDVSQVASLDSMFYYAYALDQDLGWCIDAGVVFNSDTLQGTSCVVPKCGIGQKDANGVCIYQTRPPTPAPTPVQTSAAGAVTARYWTLVGVLAGAVLLL